MILDSAVIVSDSPQIGHDNRHKVPVIVSDLEQIGYCTYCRLRFRPSDLPDQGEAVLGYRALVLVWPASLECL